MGASPSTRRGRKAVRLVVGAVVVAHGLLHLLGAAKGLGWAAVTTLSQPIGAMSGVAWLAAALLVVVAGVLLATSAFRWWVVCAVAAVVSQSVPSCAQSRPHPRHRNLRMDALHR